MCNNKNQNQIAKGTCSDKFQKSQVAATRISRNGAPIYENENKNLKHILCNNIIRKGKCNFLSTCWYSHSEEERSKNLIKQVCRYLREDGTCSKPNCRYDHSIKPKPAAVIDEYTGLKMCRFVQADGTCKYGPTCKYLHSIPERVEEDFTIDFSDSETIIEECLEIIEEEIDEDEMELINFVRTQCHMPVSDFYVYQTTEEIIY